ncbi:MAG: AI-2E family transporter [Polaromonas sp.]|uniref:AI-2E family transporter n=1 Tax=Polaromonas sp. TaxID=1869339 RepID=UPI002488BEB7|nr:AI-2E family transporter [Polaromonas sp.]MDI1237718.1 AI-2E family transporter [Polaromonas sp.]
MSEEHVPEILPAEPAAPADPEVTTFPEPERLLLHMPVDIRNMSLMVLAGLAILFVLHWAKAVFIPVMVGVLFSYALSPVVNWLELKRVPRWLSSAVLLLAILGTIGSTTWSLRNNAVQLVESLPVAAQKFRNATKVRTGQSDSTLDTVQKAASQIEQATQDGAKPGNNRGAMRVVVERASFNVKDYLWTGTIGLVALIGQAVAVIFLTYFLLLSGDSFRRKLLKLAGPSLSKKKVTLQALHEITGQIQRYLQVQLLTSALVGVLTWLALLSLGLENAAVWGIVAFVLNFVPYVGSLITAAATALVGFLQFGTLNMALIVGGASLLIHTIVGNLITPWLTSRASRLSPVAVFVGLLAWGWLWGVWGLLLGVPIMMMVKSVCDRVDDLKPLGEFLGS